ncbi:Valine--tRNA ligase [Salinivirga cyanobacteriivorans]|uniref:Valine--tRNA ligase n=1 Tax=Salinivirga cyanobacteriivorans TaxID=1307839 RepID=A0A0S2HYL7_9BACT|nr:valine--tRNA ligase [Salinivirga cyanobacteriivorans]ALO15112.1 Valine--tRNA ligase [Salinivirga cyanobacteriivorans]
MKEIPTKYNPLKTEDKWYSYWLEHGFFHSEPDDRDPYTVVIPPPNVTGVLHMGHMLNNTIQDVLVRRARMKGKNVCWVPGTDHASIATEAKVVNKLRDEGIDKHSLSRDEFLEHAWEWKEKHGGIILDQLKKLGASCDWNRTSFTMDEEYSDSVLQVFVDLYKKGKIYRGVRMVNWDPKAKTAVSDEEVIYKEEQSKLYYLKYFVEGIENEYLTIATTRPETILGDTAVCVNPNDERFRKFVGKKVIVPLVNRPVEVIEDEYVDMEFGTGALKITPAHDINDYEIGQRHNLKSIDIFNDDGTLNEAAEVLVGTDRFEARKQIIPMLEAQGNMLKIEDYTNKVGYSERTDAVIEPRLSMQWFMRMKEISKPALDAVMNDEVQFHPAKFKNTYRHWMENIQDWCISRQLWWGHRIPAWYLPNSNDFVVAQTEEEALKLAREKTGDTSLTLDQLCQDEDVLDTWFSSWLWPISVFNGLTQPDNKDIQYYYPTNDLVTAPEIMFFWVARMIIAGYEYLGKKPFENVYFTGIVRDQHRRKMSKSLGNSPDPIELMEKYGADGVRVGMLLCSPAGGDLLFDESLPEQGRNFANKIWNAFRLVKTWEVDESLDQPEASKMATAWLDAKLNETSKKLDKQFEQFRLSEALMTVYKLFWDEFSSWFLEIIKPAYQQPIDGKTMSETIVLFDRLLHILHPFMPFITEEIWHYLEERNAGESLMITPARKAGTYDSKDMDQFEQAKEVVAGVRKVRKEKNIAMKEGLDLFVNKGDDAWPEHYESVICKLANVNKLEHATAKVEDATSFLVRTHECFIPVGDMIDKEAELEKLNKELEYNKGFLNSVMKKLSNERFVNNAPKKVVDAERKKKDDAEQKIKTLEEQIANLS